MLPLLLGLWLNDRLRSATMMRAATLREPRE
jgi:hypothetical protein